MSQLNRRQVLSLAALAGAGALLGSAGRAMAADEPKKKVLFFTRSSGFPHSVVSRKPGEKLALAEKLLSEFGGAAGYDITVTKDGTIFTPEKLAQFDAILFYTTGDLTTINSGAKHPEADKVPGMPKEGKQALLDFIAAGKGFRASTALRIRFTAPTTMARKTSPSRPISCARPPSQTMCVIPTSRWSAENSSLTNLSRRRP